jgi:hypothetical protein
LHHVPSAGDQDARVRMSELMEQSPLSGPATGIPDPSPRKIVSTDPSGLLNSSASGSGFPTPRAIRRSSCREANALAGRPRSFQQAKMVRRPALKRRPAAVSRGKAQPCAAHIRQTASEIDARAGGYGDHRRSLSNAAGSRANVLGSMLSSTFSVRPLANEISHRRRLAGADRPISFALEGTMGEPCSIELVGCSIRTGTNEVAACG